MADNAQTGRINTFKNLGVALVQNLTNDVQSLHGKSFAKPGLKAAPTGQVVKDFLTFQDKRLLKIWQRDVRKKWKAATFLSKGNKKEGRQLYELSELINPQDGIQELAAINRDAAKALIVSNAVIPIWAELRPGEAITAESILSSKGFSRLIGNKLRKGRKKRFGKHFKKTRKHLKSRRFKKFAHKRGRKARKHFKRTRKTIKRMHKKRH